MLEGRADKVEDRSTQKAIFFYTKIVRGYLSHEKTCKDMQLCAQRRERYKHAKAKLRGAPGDL